MPFEIKLLYIWGHILLFSIDDIDEMRVYPQNGCEVASPLSHAAVDRTRREEKERAARSFSVRPTATTYLIIIIRLVSDC
jgi:hypothetical protein